MKRTLAALAAATLVLSACWGEEDATHETLEGTKALHDETTDCIWIWQTDGDTEIAPRNGQPVEDCIPADTTPPDTTVPAPTTTQAPAPTTTAPPVSTVPPTTQPPVDPGTFVETFDGNTGLDRLDYGLWHRDDQVIAQTSWLGDHDLFCGVPGTSRLIERDNPDDSFYLCRDHLMTSVGDTSGYSIAWFSPKQVFNGQTTVSVDVNSTNLGTRQWFKFALVPADYDSDIPECPLCTSSNSALGDFFPDAQPDNTFVYGTLTGGGRIMINNQNTRAVPKLCRDANPIDPVGCGDKGIRRTWTAVDNQDGTVTISIAGLAQVTVDGSFPEGDWRLVIHDHNYTPNKVDKPIEGTSWHWDNLIVN